VIVYLVRHGKAEKHAPEGGDAARALTAEGRARFDALAAELAPRMKVARILTSPLRRARETAEILARHCGATLTVEGALASGASDGRALLALAREAGAGAALVGHNPELVEAVALAAGRDVEVKPGTVAAVKLGPGRPHLDWLEKPA
jgi:phosphohistidine phosphatase